VPGGPVQTTRRTAATAVHNEEVRDEEHGGLSETLQRNLSRISI